MISKEKRGFKRNITVIRGEKLERGGGPPPRAKKFGQSVVWLNHFGLPDPHQKCKSG